MSWSLFVVSFGSLFYAAAEKSTWWLVLGAAILWIFWVGVNIGISKTILDLSPPTDRAAYFALYFAATTLTLALSTLFGGYFFADTAFDRFSFVLSWILRLLAIPLLWCVFGIRHEK
jgi:MFS family permease